MVEYFEIIIIVIIILVLILMFSVCCGCYYYYDNFKNIKGPYRPKHNQWYEDIPDNHPEVLQLKEETRLQVARTPKYTDTGGIMIDYMPQEIFDYLLEVNKNEPRTPEGNDNIFRRTSSGPPPYIIVIPQEKKEWIHSTIRPILEEWCGFKLKPTAAYGPREYRRGSSLRNHVDREGTHVISCILHIGRENMDKPWYLHAKDHYGDWHYIDMKPGDMVYYQSDAVEHGRPDRLNGDYYTNMFIHYAIA